jgi:glycerophosphoryl diester phosphodiesterase
MIFDAKPAVVGHRGSGPGNGENTIDSMLAALAAGAGWIEIDAQRTRDDALVLRHDPTTPAGDFIVERDRADCALPSLAEIFEGLPPEAGVNLEVNVLEDAVEVPERRTGPLLVPLLAAELKRRPLLVTSFDAALLVQLREALPELPLGSGAPSQKRSRAMRRSAWTQSSSTTSHARWRPSKPGRAICRACCRLRSWPRRGSAACSRSRACRWGRSR